ncbi:hypothetical protein [Paenibacillus sp. 1P03SA]
MRKRQSLGQRVDKLASFMRMLTKDAECDHPGGLPESVPLAVGAGRSQS